MEADDDRIARHELREATLAGVRWMTVAKIATEVVLFASTVVLAHLISPAEFGRAAVALIASAFAMAITAQSFGAPLVQREKVERAHVQAAFIMSLALGLALALATFVLAPLIAGPLFGDRTAGLLRISAALFLLAGISVVPGALLQRRLEFRRLSRIEVVSRIAGAVVAVTLAVVAGLGASAIVIGAVATAVVSTAQILVAAPPVRPRFDREAMRQIAQFGFPAALSSMVNQTTRNIDYAILGAQLGAAQVGYYWRAFQFGVEYQSKVSSIMLRVAFPVYSRARDLADMRRLRSRIVRAQATLLLPLLAFLIAVAPVMLPWLLGERWSPAVLPTQILAVAGMVTVVLTGLGPLMLALGKPKALLWWNLATVVPYTAVVFLTAPHGIVAVCIGVVGVRLATLVGAHLLLFKPLAGIPLSSLWADAGPAAVSSAALLAVCMPMTHWLSQLDASPVFLLGTVGLAGAATYGLTLRSLFRAAWMDVLLLASRVFPLGRFGVPAPAGAR